MGWLWPAAALAVPGVVKVLVEGDFPKPQSRYDWFYCTSHPRYCGDVLIQLAAASSAIQSVERIVLQNHLETCVVEEIQKGNTEVIAETAELIKKLK